MSDPTLSVIDFRNKTALVWTTLKKLSLGQYQNHNLMIWETNVGDDFFWWLVTNIRTRFNFYSILYFTCELVWDSIEHISVRFATISKLSKSLFGAAADVQPFATILQWPIDLDEDSLKVHFRFLSWHKWRHWLSWNLWDFEFHVRHVRNKSWLSFSEKIRLILVSDWFPGKSSWLVES